MCSYYIKVGVVTPNYYIQKEKNIYNLRLFFYHRSPLMGHSVVHRRSLDTGDIRREGTDVHVPSRGWGRQDQPCQILPLLHQRLFGGWFRPEEGGGPEEAEGVCRRGLRQRGISLSDRR